MAAEPDHYRWGRAGCHAATQGAALPGRPVIAGPSPPQFAPDALLRAEGASNDDRPEAEGDWTPTDSPLCVLRGGGDLATGVAWRLTRAGWPVVVLELPEPLTVRRTVALSTAVTEGEVTVQGMRGVRVASPQEAMEATRRGDVAVMVAPELRALHPVRPDVVVDARLAKRNIDTSMYDADVVVALGPGFTAGRDCHAVVETMRGPHLGWVSYRGSAQPDTGMPAEVGGHAADRVLRAPAAGDVSWVVDIGERVHPGQLLGTVGGQPVNAPFDGVLRGAIRPGMAVPLGLKIGDVDPRGDPAACREISDKALAVGDGVLEAVVGSRLLGEGLRSPPLQ